MNKTALHILGVVAVAALTSACGSGAPQSEYNPDDATDEGGSDADGGSDGGSEEQGGQGGQGNQGGQGGEPPDTDCAPGGQMSCYDGDPTTIGVGLCKEGISTCQPDGFWGACTEQVLPEAENCNSIGDEDCDGAACSDPLWHLQLHQTDWSYINDMAVGADGSIYLAGEVRGSVTLGTTTLFAQSLEGNALVAKLDASGNVLWTRFAQSSAYSSARALTIDPQGNLLVVGSFGPGFDAGGGVMAHVGTKDMYIARYNAGGGYLASHYLTQHKGMWLGQDPIGNKLPRDVVVMSNGTIAVVGQYSGHWGCLGLNCVPNDPTNDSGGFVRGYNASFGLLWEHTYDQGGTDDVTGAAALPSGGLVAVGNNPVAARIRHYEANGTGGLDTPVGDATANAVSVMANGDRLVALTKTGTDPDVMLRRVSTQFDTWTVAAIGTQRLQSAFEDVDGNIVITGSYAGSQFNLGCGALPAPGNGTAAFIAKLDGDYQCLWSKPFGGTGASNGRAVAPHPSGRIVFHGRFENGSVDFGTGPIAPQPPIESLVVMFEP